MTKEARLKRGTALAHKYRRAADSAIGKLKLAVIYAEDGAHHTAASLARKAADELVIAAKERDKFLEVCDK